MTLPMLSFQRLDVYQVSIHFVALITRLSPDASKSSGAVLDQLRRAAASIPLNIAEATGRTGKADIARHFAIARGSAMECAAALDTLAVMNVVDEQTKVTGSAMLERIVMMLTRMCR
jgi:four helix bundle protein